MDKLPDWFDASRLTPVKFYPYKSSVKDKFFEVCLYEETAKEKYYSEIKKLNEFKMKCMDTPLNMGRKGQPQYRKDVWDSKIVIECKTELGSIVYVGFFDWNYSIGLGVTGHPVMPAYEYQLPK